MRWSILNLWLALSGLLLITACATLGPPQPPSLELPKPPTDLRAVRKGNRVTLTWTIPTATTDRQAMRSVGPTRICRRLEQELRECGTPVGEAEPQRGSTATKPAGQKATASFIDTLPDQMESIVPSASITYAIEVLNPERRGAGLSNQVKVSLIRTVPPPEDFRARVTSQGIVLSLTSNLPRTRPERPNPIHYVYRIYRHMEEAKDKDKDQVLAEIPAGANALETTDSNIEWEKTYEYRAATVTVVDQDGKPAIQVEGDDTPEVKVFADDIFPPAVPSGLQAVFSGPGQQAFIDLVWAPVTDLDLDGYNVYRHEEGVAPVKVNSELVKTPAYRDTSVLAGKSYFYSVSAVDVRGNESVRSEEASERVP